VGLRPALSRGKPDRLEERFVIRAREIATAELEDVFMELTSEGEIV
jgi:hypothetical protein